MGGGRGQPSAKTPVLELRLLACEAGSRIKTAKERSTQRIAGFFTAGTLLADTVRASVMAKDQSFKMF
jgi:hypothetical protein